MLEIIPDSQVDVPASATAFAKVEEEPRDEGGGTVEEGFLEHARHEFGRVIV